MKLHFLFFHHFIELADDFPPNLHKNSSVYLILQSYLLKKGHWFLNSKKLSSKNKQNPFYEQIEVILNFFTSKIIVYSKTTLKQYGKRVFSMIHQYQRTLLDYIPSCQQIHSKTINSENRPESQCHELGRFMLLMMVR